MNFKHSLRELDPAFSETSKPEPFSQPELLLWNQGLAEELGLTDKLLNHEQERCAFFSGQKSAVNSSSYSFVYAGHQFGQFSGRLGDGRAHMLGEWTAKNGQLVDVQLKGSGRTPFSRAGDGLCALAPALREYLMGEAMHALGVPTTRSLSVVATGDDVMREGLVPGAVVSRVAQSHLRVGTFQWFAATEQHEALAKLCAYTLKRHYPSYILSEEALEKDHAKFPEQILKLLDAVIDKQIELVCHWQRVGFIHGVMNTDNCSIAGETIDFGPCAMLGSYHPEAVYSSIDRNGRYAFGQQPSMMNWNLARLAESLLPLLHKDVEQALALCRPLIESVPDRFDQAYYHMLAKKFGLSSFIKSTPNKTPTQSQRSLINDMLKHMQINELDYTLSFRQLKRYLEGKLSEPEIATLKQYFSGDSDKQNSLECWLNEVSADKNTAISLMAVSNPELIPRNYFVEHALDAAVKNDDLSLIKDYMLAWSEPYKERKDSFKLLGSKAEFDTNYRTFCGT
ncbi:YdiU family protein [Agaribacterium sp. ZY112]|uniref:protein adenylyltransferase SelO n=1 Tax=Agaribacterium sp. ZY112 TaxID=3233574 RepID=UPI003524EBD9